MHLSYQKLGIENNNALRYNLFLFFFNFNIFIELRKFISLTHRFDPVYSLSFTVELYMSPVETWCRNINYFIPEEGKTKEFGVDQMTKIRK